MNLSVLNLRWCRTWSTLVASMLLLARPQSVMGSLVPMAASHPRYEALSQLLRDGLAHASEAKSARRVVRGETVELRADVFLETRRKLGVRRALRRLGRSSAEKLRLATAGGSRGAARRGTSFAFSPDGRFMIKEESKASVEALCRVAEDMTAASTGPSLLPRFVGAYEVYCGGKRTHWVVMHNVLFAPGCVCRRVYDLKGSTAGRRAKRPDATRKDLDALTDKRHLEARAGPRLMRVLERDTAFLEAKGFLDYSLLVGILEPRLPWVSRLFRGPVRWLRRRARRRRGVAGLAPQRGNRLLLIGIIDVLQRWDLQKRLEFLCRGAYAGYSTISAVPPRAYRARFLSFLDGLFFAEKSPTSRTSTS